MKNRDASELINIGRIGSSVGLRGEVRVTLYAPDSVNLKEGKVLLLKHAQNSGPKSKLSSAEAATHERDKNSAIETKVLGVRLQKDRPVVKLEGIIDRNAADSIRDMQIYIAEDQLEKLPEGEHYVRDIIGARVHDLAAGKDIGLLSDVIQNTAQNILEVKTEDGRTILIPAVDAFLRKIDEEEGLIQVELIPGFY